ncbi:MAG: polysaccharide deacetylase family protein [Tissierellaceae bacterium]|nr:polysaccharide deacetylase family protein [Tissierellaceae bacterium]
MTKKGKIILSVCLVIGILTIGIIPFKFNLFTSKAEATDISDTLSNIGVNSPIKLLLNDQFKLIQLEKANRLLEEKRAIIEAQRLQEEQKRLEEERLEILENDPNAKFAYLTFDDGPSEKHTNQILDILKEYDIKATFFVVGSMTEKYPDLLKRIYDEGHVIGNHSYSHVYKYIYKNSTNFIDDLNKADKVLKDILGESFETKLLRFPGGSFGKHKAPMIKAAEKEGYTIYDWNALNGDAEGLNLKNSYLIRRLKETTRNKKHAIILMHDTDAKKGTVETLKENIDYLISRGFHFRVLEEKND